jgi:hypothetical protein
MALAVDARHSYGSFLGSAVSIDRSIDGLLVPVLYCPRRAEKADGVALFSLKTVCVRVALLPTQWMLFRLPEGTRDEIQRVL